MNRVEIIKRKDLSSYFAVSELKKLQKPHRHFMMAVLK